MTSFNIFAQVQRELDEYNNDTVLLAQSMDGGGGYQFSQKDTLHLIELYHSSKFESGEKDAEGQRKMFLNIVRFRQEVAEKQTDLDVKDFVFIPEDDTSEFPALYLNKKFRQWAKKKKYGKIINELNRDYSKCGSCVGKVVGDTIERVPLLTLRNQQNAKSLAESSFVIEEHKDMTLSDIEKYQEWELQGLNMKWGEKTTVYERYGYVPLDYFKRLKDEKVEDGDELKSVYAMFILTLDKTKAGANPEQGHTLFFEETECPYREAHWSRMDGRWLGVGEVEKNFENQVFRNMITNMRRRGLLWASKKVFQSTDTDIAHNLVRDVKDGQVLKVMPNGQISQVNMTTQGLQEYESAAREVDQNADKTSFTFEVATGEGMPSGTPFRLGVILSKAVDSYYSLKRENFGLFMEEIVFDLLLPAFKKENKEEHTIFFDPTDDSFQRLRKHVIDSWVYRNAVDLMLAGKPMDLETIRAKVEKEINSRPGDWLRIPEGLYDQVAANVSLVSTGENINIEKRIETLTTLYQSLAQNKDPRAEKVLAKILSLTGEDYESLVGQAPEAAPQQAGQSLAPDVGQGSAGMDMASLLKSAGAVNAPAGA